MPAFTYQATTASGIPTSGTITADSVEAARTELAARGLAVAALEPVQFVGAASASEPVVSGLSGALTADEHVEAVAQIGSLINARVPLHIGMRTLAEELPGRRLRQTFQRMSDRLQAGDLLEQVVASEGRALPPFLTGLLESGVSSGRLADCVERYVAFSRVRVELRAHVWTSLLYPLVLFVVGGGLLFLLAAWIFPQFRSIFEGFGVELPGLTNVVLSIGSFATAVVEMHFTGWLVLALLLLIAVKFIRSVALKSPAFWGFLHSIPVVGAVVRSAGMSQFCHLMSILISRGVELPAALELTGASLTDARLSSGATELSCRVAAGNVAFELRGRSLLPWELLSLLSWNDDERGLSSALSASGDLYAAQCDVGARSLSAVLTPLVVIFVGGCIALSVLGLFMPLIKLLNDLS